LPCVWVTHTQKKNKKKRGRGGKEKREKAEETEEYRSLVLNSQEKWSGIYPGVLHDLESALLE
jgi:hypothetical protein